MALEESLFFHLVEAFFSIGMFVNAALFIPQAIKVYIHKDAGSLSLITFAGFNLIQLSMVLHGYIHHDWFLVVGMGLSFFTCACVTVQIIVAEVRSKLKKPSV